MKRALMRFLARFAPPAATDEPTDEDLLREENAVLRDEIRFLLRELAARPEPDGLEWNPVLSDRSFCDTNRTERRLRRLSVGPVSGATPSQRRPRR